MTKYLIQNLIKSIYIFTLPALIMLPAALKAQTADEIIEKHIEACGGQKAFEALEKLKITGQYTAFSLEKPFEFTWFKGGKYYTEFSLGKHDVKEAYDGNEGWTIDPWQDMLFPRKATTAEKNVFQQKAELVSPFFNYKKKGYEPKYLRKDTTEGNIVHVLELSKPNGNTETWHFNADTYLAYKYSSRWTDFTYPINAETYFDDYREVGGLMFPHYIERIFGTRNRMTIIEQIDLNPKVNETLLVMPRSKEMQALEFLIGHWEVVPNFWTRRNTWHEGQMTESLIAEEELNLFREQMSYQKYFVREKNIHFSYSDKKGSYMMIIYNGLGSDTEIWEGNFIDADLVFESPKIQDSDSKQQYTFSEISDESFTLTLKTSADEGETWKPSDKFVYKRKK
jgi:hypothetical protein